VTTATRDITKDFEGLLESAPDAMVIVDQGGIVLQVNSQTENLFGFTRNEMLGKTVETLVPERYRGAHVGHRQGFSSDPRVRPMGLDAPLNGLRKDGSEFPVEISLSPWKTEYSTYAVAAIRDVSERRRIEEIKREADQTFRPPVRAVSATKE
jgi:protein-histidine pros-kinase